MTDKVKDSYAFVGWAVSIKNYTIDQLENMDDFELIMLMNDWDKFKQEN